MKRKDKNMKGKIEIIIRKNEGGVNWVEVTAEKCSQKDITFTGLCGVLSIVAGDIKTNVPAEKQEQTTKEFGELMSRMLLGMVQEKIGKQRRYEGKEANFSSALMKQQGKVQEK